jgi:hypothetical protein
MPGAWSGPMPERMPPLCITHRVNLDDKYGQPRQICLLQINRSVVLNY